VASAETVEAVEVEVRIGASPETVFDFFVDPKLMMQWMGRAVDVDPRPGGHFRNEIRDDTVASGEYIAVEPPRRVVFTWGWEGGGPTVDPGESTVEVLLDADGDGTRVRLIHHDLPDAESARKHGHGWRHYLDRLGKAAVGEDPGPDVFTTPPA